MLKRRGLFILIGVMLIIAPAYTLPYHLYQTTPGFDQLLEQVELNPGQSFSLIKIAERFSQNPQDSMRITRAYATSYFANGLIDKAIERIKNSLMQAVPEVNNELSSEFAQSHLLLQALLDENIDYQSYSEKSTAFSEISSSKKNKDIIGFNYLGLGNQSWYSERYTEAEFWWKKALDYAELNGVFKLRVQSMHKLGFVYVKERKFQSAISQYKYILSLIKGEKYEFHEDELLALNALGNGFSRKNELDSAIHYLNSGLRLLHKRKRQFSYSGHYHEYLGLLSNNIGSAELRRKNFIKARDALNLSIKSSAAHYGDSSTQLIRSLRDLGTAYHHLQNDSSALSAHKRAVQISKLNGFDRANSYARAGKFHYKIGDWKAASEYYDSALYYNGSFLNDKKDVYIYTSDLFTILFGKVETLLAQGMVRSSEFDLAYERFRETLIFFYKKSEKVQVYRLLPLGFENFYHGFGLLYQKTKDPHWLNRQWDVIELNKMVKLGSRLNDQIHMEFSVPEEVLATEKELRDSINLVLGQLKPGSFDSTFFLLNRHHQTFLENIEKQYPKYYHLKTSLRITKLKEVIKDRRKGELLLNFFEGQGLIHMIGVSNDKVINKRVDKAVFQQAIEQHNQGILEVKNSLIETSSLKLLNLLGLNEGLFNEIEHIIIVPDGITWSLNFSSLLTKENAFLGDLVTLSFQYYAGNEPQVKRKRKKSMLALAISDGKTNLRQNLIHSGVVDIPGTHAEVTSISNIWEGDSYFGMDASETMFKNKAGNHNLIHLAVHGFEDQHTPENSYLLLSSSDRLNDGRLHAYEIYNLDLQADLAVLSACHSGKGNPVSGEGMMSLGKAFAYAGVSATLVSRWEVSDYSTPFMMRYFYTGLKKGMRKSEALRYAQEEYLANHTDALSSSPFYWSSFYVLGDDSPIYKPDDIGYWVILWAILVCLSTGLFLKKNRLAPA